MKNKGNNSNVFIIATVVISVVVLGFLMTSRQGQPTSNEKDLITKAESLGMDGDQFFKDYRSSEIRAKATENRTELEDRVGSPAVSTPSIYLNGEKVNNTADYQSFVDTVLQPYLDSAADGEVVKMEVFESFTCPACARFFPIYQLVERNFQGKVEVISKFFQLNEGDNTALQAAYAAEAAGVQGQFDEYTRLLFEDIHGLDYSELLDENSTTTEEVSAEPTGNEETVPAEAQDKVEEVPAQ